jgi:hypothetical protein
MKTLSIVVLSVVGLLAVVSVVADRSQMGVGGATEGPNAQAVVDANGNLKVPADYRTSYRFLGGWAIAADKGQGSREMHVVYASPGTIAAYRKDGHFPDGSVLVKEVFQGSPIVSKKGKAEIRYALYQAALVASTRDKHFVTYFTDQLRGREKEKGIKTKKRVKLAAKML